MFLPSLMCHSYCTNTILYTTTSYYVVVEVLAAVLVTPTPTVLTNN